MAEMRFDTTRSDEQRRRMQKCKDEGMCYLCERIARKEHIVKQNRHWYIIKNDFPYEGTVHHYLIIPKRHIVNLDDLNSREESWFFNIHWWLKRELGVTGFSMFVRSGDMQYTHASLDHVHFQFIVGTKKKTGSEKIKVTLGYKEKPR